MTEALIDFPTIEAAPMPDAAPPIAAVAKTTAIADSISAVHGEVAKFDQIAAGLARIEAAHPKNVIVADIATSAGFKVAETGWRAYRNPRLEVERARKAAKAPVLALGKAIDTFAGDLETRLRDGEDHYKSQIDAEETRRAAEKAEAARIEAERVAKHQANIANIRAFLARCNEPGMTADRIASGIKMLAEWHISDEWQEFVGPALAAQVETLQGMRTLHAQATEREAEAARLEAQRVENERVAREQAEQRAELARQAEALKAQQERIAGLQARIAEIRAAATGHEKASAADLREAAVAVAALDVSEAQYAEFAALAQAERATTLAVLEKLHADAVQRERDAAAAESVRITLMVAEAAVMPDLPQERVAEVMRELSATPEGDRGPSPNAGLPAYDYSVEPQAIEPALVLPDGGYVITLEPESTMYAELSATSEVEPGTPLMRGELGQIDGRITFVESAPAPDADPQAAFLLLVMSAFDCKFPSHPKPSIAWWAAVRKAGEELRDAA